MTTVDTHCHAGITKYEPIETLLYHMASAGVDKAVLIQHAGITDNSYLVECLQQHPGRFAAAMGVAPDDDGSRIRHWAAQGMGGIRLAAASRASSADPLAHWRTAAELDLVVSAPCNPAALLGPEFTEIIDTFPDLRIVIEHLGGVGVKAQPPYDEFRRMLGLAARPNLTIKLPGFGEFCPVPLPEGNFPPLARLVVEAFGPQRVMWGSDFPPVSSREGYDASFRVPQQYFSDLSSDEQAAIFGGTALAVWGFPQ
jgi:L-fuconolactonase